MTDDMMASRSPHAESPAPGKIGLAPHPIAVTTHDSPCHNPRLRGHEPHFRIFHRPCWAARTRAAAVPPFRFASRKRGKNRCGSTGDLASPWLLAAEQRHKSGYIACNHHGIPAPGLDRRLTRVGGMASWPSWRRGSSLDSFRRARSQGQVRKGGGSLVRQAPGHRSCLEPPQTLEPPSL